MMNRLSKEWKRSGNVIRRRWGWGWGVVGANIDDVCIRRLSGSCEEESERTGHDSLARELTKKCLSNVGKEAEYSHVVLLGEGLQRGVEEVVVVLQFLEREVGVGVNARHKVGGAVSAIIDLRTEGVYIGLQRLTSG